MRATLLAHLKSLPDLEAPARDIAKALGWLPGEPAKIANQYRSSFITWIEEYTGRRTTYVAIHPDLRRFIKASA